MADFRQVQANDMGMPAALADSNFISGHSPKRWQRDVTLVSLGRGRVLGRSRVLSRRRAVRGGHVRNGEPRRRWMRLYGRPRAVALQLGIACRNYTSRERRSRKRRAGDLAGNAPSVSVE